MVPSWGLILSNSNRNYDVSSLTNVNTRNWPITEWIHCDELLFTTNCQSSSTNLPIFYNTITDCDWSWQAKYKCITNSWNYWKAKTANISAKNYTLLNVSIAAFIQFINSKLWEFLCIVILFVSAKFWAYLKYAQKFD